MKAMVISMWAVCLTLACEKKMQKSYFKTVGDTFCNVSTLLETTADYDLRCALTCGRDAQCMAYSHRGSQCFLHDDFCSSSELLPEAGAYYARE